jgi:NAD(P)-dependent dehydrogenase (short-subunit alcohol dehydrogenase family)
VNNAAAFHFGPLAETTDDEWHRILDTNVMAYSNFIREAHPYMKEAGGGSVVNIASMSSCE